MSLVATIVQQYSLPPIDAVNYLGGAGGFSGAQLWKLQAGGQTFCLRRWPYQYGDAAKLDWMSLVLNRAAVQGCPVPVPRSTTQGSAYVWQYDHFWEVSPWLPGQANFSDDANDVRLKNTLVSLANFHLSSAQVNLGFAKSKNVTSRLKTLAKTEQRVHDIQRCQATTDGSHTKQLCELVLALGVAASKQLTARLARFADDVFPVQPVIRDIWHDHVLFVDDTVTGIVDFGAMQTDNVALDLSRLLGSLVGDQPHRWQTAIETYSESRPLSTKEIELLTILDQSAVFLGGLNWLQWLLVERREFESVAGVNRRINHLIERLKRFHLV